MTVSLFALLPSSFMVLMNKVYKYNEKWLTETIYPLTWAVSTDNDGITIGTLAKFVHGVDE